MKHLLTTLVMIVFTIPVIQGQQIQSDTLTGEWQGTVTSKLNQLSAQGPISLSFRSAQRVSITTPKQEEGTFTVEGESIIITLRDAPTEPIRLNHVRIRRDSMRAELIILSDPPGMSNIIELSRVTTQSQALAQASVQKVCNDLNLPEGVLKIFEKYEIDCPIKFPANGSYYELAFYRRLLSEVIRELIGQSYDLTYAKQRLSIKVPNAARAVEVENVLIPLLQTPSILDIENTSLPRCPLGMKCALEFLDVRSLKPEYVSNGKIDFNRVWSKIIQIAESHNVRFVATGREGNSGSAQTGAPSPVAQNQNGLFYEKISVQMTDEYASTSSLRGTYIRLLIKSEIWHKKAASVKRALRIEDQCSVGTSGIFGFTCSDKPIMNDIIRAISNEQRGI